MQTQLPPQLLAVLILLLSTPKDKHMNASTVLPKSYSAIADKADKKADALKTPAHRHEKDARFEEEARIRYEQQMRGAA